MNPDLSVLYVEDHVFSIRVMDLLLKGRLKLRNVVFFEDSENFVSRVLALDPRPDVIFLDIHIKPLNGFEMLEILRNLKELSNVPIIALTASVMNDEIQQLRRSGFNGCLAKPIDLEQFPIQLQRIMAGETIWFIS